MNFSFAKTERLCSHATIKILREKGKQGKVAPFNFLYLPIDAPKNAILVRVPKQNIRRANKRNTLKRRIREAYRLNKNCLVAPPAYAIQVLYTEKDILPYSAIEQGIIAILNRINNEK